MTDMSCQRDPPQCRVPVIADTRQLSANGCPHCRSINKCWEQIDLVFVQDRPPLSSQLGRCMMPDKYCGILPSLLKDGMLGMETAQTHRPLRWNASAEMPYVPTPQS